MKLFYSPHACSMAPHIVLHELGVKFELEKVDLKAKKTAKGDFWKQNPKGYVPALFLENGELLTEGVVIMQYLADQKPEAKLIPKAGTWERYRAMEWLNFIATELHKNFSPFFYVDKIVHNKEGLDQFKTGLTEILEKKLSYVADQLKGKTYLMGNQYTVADAYLYTVLTWTKWVDVDLSKWPALMGYVERVQTRPATAKALAAEEKGN